MYKTQDFLVQQERKQQEKILISLVVKNQVIYIEYLLPF